MKLKKALSDIADTYITDIDHLGEFIDNTNKYIENISKLVPQKGFGARQKKELSKFLNILNDLVHKAPKEAKVTVKMSNVTSEIIMASIKSFKYRSYFAEMGLVYLLSYQEAFLKDYIYQILINRKEMLKSGSTITYEQLLKHSSVKAIIKHKAQSEVDNLGYGSIDDVSEYFYKKMNISLSDYKDWNKLREINYRRNIIIHNRGISNEVYCKKTGIKPINRHIITNVAYVKDCISVVKGLIQFIQDNVYKKYGLS